MKCAMLLTMMMVTLALATMPARAADPAVDKPAVDKVMACMRANIPQTVRIQDFQITSYDRNNGQRMLKGKLYGKNDKGLVRSMVKIMAPADLANAAYLVREGKEKDEMYVFLPALNRTRRITGASADGPLFGTDLSYADIKQVQNAFSGGAVKLEAPDTLEARPMYVLSLVPRADAQSRYNLIKGWVDQKTCVALKLEFYEGAAPRKRLLSSAASLKQSGTRWYVSDAEMRDLKGGTRTTLKITGVTNDASISDTYFGATTFYVGG